MLGTLQRWLGKKTPPPPLPEKFGLVGFSDSSKNMHVGGEHNKVIRIYEHGQEVDRIPYSKARHQVLLHVQKIPIADLTEGSDHPNIEWHHTANPGLIDTHTF